MLQIKKIRYEWTDVLYLFGAASILTLIISLFIAY